MPLENIWAASATFSCGCAEGAEGKACEIPPSPSKCPQNTGHPWRHPQYLGLCVLDIICSFLHYFLCVVRLPSPRDVCASKSVTRFTNATLGTRMCFKWGRREIQYVNEAQREKELFFFDDYVRCVSREMCRLRTRLFWLSFSKLSAVISALRDFQPWSFPFAISIGGGKEAKNHIQGQIQALRKQGEELCEVFAIDR